MSGHDPDGWRNPMTPEDAEAWNSIEDERQTALLLGSPRWTRLMYQFHLARSEFERYRMIAELEEPGTTEGAALASIVTWALVRGRGELFFGSFSPRRNLVRRNRL